MDEIVLKEVKASYLKTATNMLEGYLVLTNKRIFYSGTQARIRMNHGAIGNVIRDKMETAMGYDNPEEEHLFDIPLGQLNCSLKRYGLSKRVVLSDHQGNEFKLMVYEKKAERDQWPVIIEKAKQEIL
jgi:hypothetical protein